MSDGPDVSDFDRLLWPSKLLEKFATAVAGTPRLASITGLHIFLFGNKHEKNYHNAANALPYYLFTILIL